MNQQNSQDETSIKTAFFSDIDKTAINRDAHNDQTFLKLEEIQVNLKQEHEGLYPKFTHISKQDYLQIYEQFRDKKSKHVPLSLVVQKLSAFSNIPEEELWKIYRDFDFKDMVTEGFDQLLDFVLKNESSKVIYYTDGDETTQTIKVESGDIFKKDDPRYELKAYDGDKADHFTQEFQNVIKEGCNRIIVADDKAQVLLKAKLSMDEINQIRRESGLAEIEFISIHISKELYPEGNFTITAETPLSAAKQLDGYLSIEGQTQSFGEGTLDSLK